MKILSVVGARPNFMKIAPVIKAIDKYNKKRNARALEHILVHTGQHYDEYMSDVFFRELQIPKPDIFLGVGSASHAAQTAEIMTKFEKVLIETHPHIVLVVGDVNSTIACALVASKITYGRDTSRPLIAHVEAGLRSFDCSMPEEINRILTDHVSDLLFVTEDSGLRNLRKEGVPGDRIFFVGNTMIDTLSAFRSVANESGILDMLGLRKKAFHSNPAAKGRTSTQPYALVTLHRPSNVDDKINFCNIIKALNVISKEIPILFPCHPRTRNKIKEFKLDSYFTHAAVQGQTRHLGIFDHGIGKVGRRIYLLNPQGYIDFLCLMSNAQAVFTDSGGIQEETTCLGVPCITIRNNTERPVTVTEGTNIIATVHKDKIVEAFEKNRKGKMSTRIPKYWDGKASERIIKIISRHRVKGDKR
jgi:UDP-N-acetylglucosamine 2-epimerase (non-hydrolysing)